MAVVGHFLWTVFFAAVWLGMGAFIQKVDDNPERSIVLSRGLRALRSGILMVAVSAFVAVCISHSGLVMTADDSRGYAFFALFIGLSLIGFPIGFLVGIARGQHLSDE